MKREGSQIPFAFNNDRDIARVKKMVSTMSNRDLAVLQMMADKEDTRRANSFKNPDQKGALAGFLDNISFDYFCTFTTRKPVSLFATRRIAEKVCDHVDAGNTSSVFWAAEEFDVRDGFHFHALMKLPPERKVLTVDGTYKAFQEYRKMELFNWYFAKYGRCQLIDNREPDRQLAASHYVSKYVTKKITDYDMRISKYHMR